MPYGNVGAVKAEITKCNLQIETLTTEVSELQHKLQKTQEQLQTACYAFCEAKKSNVLLKKR